MINNFNARNRAFPRRILAYLALPALVWAAASAMAIPASSADQHSANRGFCADVIFIGARGSGEKKNSKYNNMGPSVSYIAERMKDKLSNYGESMSMEGLDYPALGVEILIPSTRQIALANVNLPIAIAAYRKNNFNRYIASINKGTRRMKQAIISAASRCENSDIILGGYSQGAMTIHQAQQQLEASGDEAGYAIAGSILLGDGDRAKGSRTRRFGSAPRAGQGIRTYFNGNNRRDVPDPEYTASICDKGDPVCDFSPGFFRHPRSYAHKHTSYLKERKGLLNRAVDWLARDLFD